MKLNLHLKCIVLSLLTVFTYAKLRLCVVKSGLTHSIINEICPHESQLNAAGCIIANDRLSCMRLVINGIADFTVFEPEDLIIAADNLERHIMVTHEIKRKKTETARQEMVALMHNDLYDISSVRKSKLCYPGLDISDVSDRLYTSYFENKLIARECDPRKTLLENRISSLSHNFEAACIAGAWSLDSNFDIQLKSKYKNLCALCQNPLGCYSDDKYYGREGALICLTDNVGDVAWTRWSSYLLHFKQENITASENYNYLCSDRTVRPCSAEKCTWIKEPWPVIIARAEVAKKVSQLVARMIISEDPFLRLIKAAVFDSHIVNLEPMLSPEAYLESYSDYVDAMSPFTCYPPREVRWCVTSNLEYRKCESMRSAAIAYNIYPKIFCIQENSRASCIDAIKEKYADVFITTQSEELQARKNGLKPILRMLSNNRDDLNTIGIMVKKNSNFNSFKDLKNAKACFTGYQNIEWNAVVAQIINSTGKKLSCSDVKIVSDYFGQSCIYGMTAKNSSVPSNLYNLCNQFKGNHSFIKYSDDPSVMAMKCLSEVGDVAFVNISRAKEVFQEHEKNFAEAFKVLCTDSSNSDCFLTWTALGLIMVNENITTLVEDDTREMILAMDRYFGLNYHGKTPLFSLYEPYDHVKNVIFPEKTKHLHREINHVRSGKSYTNVLDVVLKHETNCDASSANIIQNKLFYFIVIFMIVRCMHFY